MYITGCRAHLCYLPGLGEVGHSPRGTSGSTGTLNWVPMWSDSKSTCHQISYHPKPDRLISCHMAGWLAKCSWQAGWVADCLSNKMLTWPSLPANIWPTWSLTGWYLVTCLVGWLIAAGKLAGWLTAYETTCQLDTLPRQRHLVAMCVTTLVT